jgi:hypothetical protein
MRVLVTLRKSLSILILFALLEPAQATSVSTDQSDLWFIPSESGWGMQLVQRDSVIFATLFVYGPSGSPTWYVSTMNNTGNLLWSGPLYATTGPWFGTVPFNAASVTATQVGSMTWSAAFVESGTVTYSVNGVVVTKNVVRQTLVNDNYNGAFPGAIRGTVTGCFNPSNNGTNELFATLVVAQVGSNVTLASTNETGSICTYVGAFSQSGQFGKMVGNYSCTTGEIGTFNIFEMNVGFNYLTGRFSANGTNTGCQTSGYFGGIRHR